MKYPLGPGVYSKLRGVVIQQTFFKMSHYRSLEEVAFFDSRTVGFNCLSNANGFLYLKPNFLHQNTAVGIPIISAMTKKEISSGDFLRLIHRLMSESIPLIALFTNREHVVSKLYGFVGSVTPEVGMVFAAQTDAQSESSSIRIPFLLGCKYFLEEASDLPGKSREEVELRYGNMSALMTTLAGSRLMIFFTLPNLPFSS
jgi:hypothetical protein